MTVHVAVGVIVNSAGEVLLAKRPEHVHQGGLWEFPGGKVEGDETVKQALARELAEELAILVKSCQPMICIQHHYGDKSVLLDVWKISGYEGTPIGNEGQVVRWVAKEQLPSYSFPAANAPIVAAVRLPDRLIITPDTFTLKQLSSVIESSATEHGISVLQLRAPTLNRSDYLALFDKVSPLCRAADVCLIANTSPAIFADIQCQGLHLNSQQLDLVQERPVARDKWLSASCHSVEQIEKATVIGADFALLSPILPTLSHPEASTLGWDRFQQWVRPAKIPVYALGGLSAKDIVKSQALGGQGVAAISAFWGSPQP